MAFVLDVCVLGAVDTSMSESDCIDFLHQFSRLIFHMTIKSALKISVKCGLLVKIR